MSIHPSIHPIGRLCVPSTSCSIWGKAVPIHTKMWRIERPQQGRERQPNKKLITPEKTGPVPGAQPKKTHTEKKHRGKQGGKTPNIKNGGEGGMWFSLPTKGEKKHVLNLSSQGSKVSPPRHPRHNSPPEVSLVFIFFGWHIFGGSSHTEPQFRCSPGCL